MPNETEKTYRYLSETQLSGEYVKAEFHRVGQWVATQYGKLKMSMDMMEDAVRNFKDNVMGRKILGNNEHKDELGALSELHDLKIEGDKLVGYIKPVEGVEMSEITSKRPYISLEYFENYKAKESGKRVGTTIINYAHTIAPVLTQMSPSIPVILSENLELIKLSESINDRIARPVIADDNGNDESDTTSRKDNEMEEKELKKLKDDKEQADAEIIRLKADKEKADTELKELKDKEAQAETARILSERKTRIQNLKTYPFIKNALVKKAEGEKVIKLNDKVELKDENDFDFAISLIEQMPVDSTLLKELSENGHKGEQETDEQKAIRLSEEGKKEAEKRSGKKGSN